MDEARSLLRRLDRIQHLDREGASPALLLTELRALVIEAEVWVRVEAGPTEPPRERSSACGSPSPALRPRNWTTAGLC